MVSKIKPVGIKILLIFLSVFSVLFMIELYLHFCGSKFFLWQTNPCWVTQLDRELIYSLQPNKTGYFRQDEFIEQATTNSLGLRDKALDDYAKYDGRIIALGDSFTFGYGVDNGQTYPDFLASFFSADNKNTDVVNAGVHGYGSDQAYKFYKTRLFEKIQHDVLIFGINVNDIEDNISNPLYTIEDNRLKPVDPTRTWIYFLTDIYQKAPTWIQKSGIFHFILSRLKGRDLFSLLPKTDKKGLLEWSKKKIILEIKALKRLTREKGINLIVVTMPAKDTSEDPYAWLERDLTESGITILPVHKNPLWKEKAQFLFYQKDPHLNINGYRTLAGQIYMGLKNSQ